MCGGSPPRDNSAEVSRQAEEARQRRIAQGRSVIDQEFQPFNDDFFNQYKDDYLDYYDPQLEKQYGDANRQLTLNLARQGVLASTHANRRTGDLQEYYDAQRTGITNRALNAANELRSNVDLRKSQLYSDNRAAADPGNAASMAASAAQSLQPSMPTSPLANAFSDFFNNAGNAAIINSRSKPYTNTGVQTFNGSSNPSVMNIG